jgi:5-methyltetrahydrofolate--homocysteine methyltransferase
MSQRFLDALHSGRVLLMDGAMGTELQRAGLRAGERGELWNLTHPDPVRAVHQAYVDAGAEVVLTNTFQVHSLSIAPDAMEQFQAVCFAATRLASGDGELPRWVLADIGVQIDPQTRQEFTRVGDVAFAAISTAPAEALLFETCSSARVRNALKRTRDWGCATTALLSLTYRKDEDGRIHSQSGHLPEWFAKRAGPWGFAALGVNCGRDISVGDCTEIIRRYRRHTDLPLFARPNAGTPSRIGEQWVYPQSPEGMATALPGLLEAGVSMIGGCCGTTPAHIAAFRKVIDAWNARH